MKEIRCENCIWHDDWGENEENTFNEKNTYCCNTDEDVPKNHRCKDWMNDRGENASAFLMRKHNEKNLEERGITQTLRAYGPKDFEKMTLAGRVRYSNQEPTHKQKGIEER